MPSAGKLTHFVATDRARISTNLPNKVNDMVCWLKSCYSTRVALRLERMWRRHRRLNSGAVAMGGPGSGTVLASRR